jgi:hypothetical protein
MRQVINLIILSLILICSIPIAYSSGYLVAYWSFNENAGTTAADSSVNNNDGTLNGTLWTTGINSSALAFDGINDYVNVPHNETLNLGTGNFTISVWTKVNSPEINDRCVFAKDLPGAPTGLIRLSTANDNSGKIMFDTNSGGGAGTKLYSATILNAEAWYHIVVRRYNSNYTIWVNGIYDNSTPENTFGSLDSIQPMIIGGRYDFTADTFFNGTIDELKIYNYALDDSEILAEYNANAPCIENWTVQYEVCLSNGTQLKYYTDQNSCGTTDNLPADDGTYVACDYCFQKIVFHSYRDGESNIYVMNSDGTGVTQLTNSPGYYDVYPAWSPDGTKIAFESDRNGVYEVFIMDADGSNQISLSNGSAQAPRWSPDGSKIVFQSIRDGNYEVYVMDADGSNQINLINNPAKDGRPTWSPDGTKIAFFSERDGNWEIYIMNSDGTGQTRLTNEPTPDNAPAWSPDGTKIAFESDRDGNREIYIMNSDGTGQTRLTNNSAHEENSAWSPDGTKIAFASDRDGNLEIYTMNPDGSNQQRLTNEPTTDNAPAWSPCICVENWTANYDVCLVDDSQLKYYTDQNSCGTSLDLPSDNGTYVACDYCTPNITNGSWSAWQDQTPCQTDDTKTQNRSRIEYDVNLCFSITGLGSDQFTNNTYWEFNQTACDYCTPNWVLNGTWGECQPTNLQFKNYYDNNSCNEGSIPNSINQSCEFTYINGSTNITGNYTGVLDIIFKQGNEILAEFSYNFSDKVLNLSNISVERQNGVGDVKGYIFVKGIQPEETKTLYLHNVSPNFNWVCIKDAELEDISEITSNCKGANEYHVQCNNQTSSGYRCEDLGNNVYKITGLQHSGIIQAADPSTISTSSSGGGGNTKYCGDRICSNIGAINEDCNNCPQDCGLCQGALITSGTEGTVGEDSSFESSGGFTITPGEDNGGNEGGDVEESTPANETDNGAGTPGVGEATGFFGGIVGNPWTWLILISLILGLGYIFLFRNK